MLGEKEYLEIVYNMENQKYQLHFFEVLKSFEFRKAGNI